MLTPIPVDEFVGYFVKANPEFDSLTLQNSCVQALEHKRQGAKCICCGQPIWALAYAVSGVDMCFTCQTGQADDSEDYEIE